MNGILEIYYFTSVRAAIDMLIQIIRLKFNLAFDIFSLSDADYKKGD